MTDKMWATYQGGVVRFSRSFMKALITTKDEVKKNFRVYYKKEPDFRVDDDLDIKDVFDNFAPIATICCESYGQVFMYMQGEEWSPMGEANELIRGAGLHHTSMSVGDVVYDAEADVYYQCDYSGWKAIPKKGE